MKKACSCFAEDAQTVSRRYTFPVMDIDASKRIKNSILESYAKLYTLFLFVLLFLLEAIPGTVIMIPGYPYHTTIYRYSYCNIEPALRLNCAPFISFMLTVCCALLFLARGALINRAASIIANKVVLLTIGTTILEGGPDELDKVRLFEINIDDPSGEDIPHTLLWSGGKWTHD